MLKKESEFKTLDWFPRLLESWLKSLAENRPNKNHVVWNLSQITISHNTVVHGHTLDFTIPTKQPPSPSWQLHSHCTLFYKIMAKSC